MRCVMFGINSRWRYANEGQCPDHRAVWYGADWWRSPAQLWACSPESGPGVCVSNTSRQKINPSVIFSVNYLHYNVSGVCPRCRRAVRRSLTEPPSTPSWWSRSCYGAGLSCSRWRLRVPGCCHRLLWAAAVGLIQCVTSSWARFLLKASPLWVLSATCSGLNHLLLDWISVSCCFLHLSLPSAALLSVWTSVSR